MRLIPRLLQRLKMPRESENIDEIIRGGRRDYGGKRRSGCGDPGGGGSVPSEDDHSEMQRAILRRLLLQLRCWIP